MREETKGEAMLVRCKKSIFMNFHHRGCSRKAVKDGYCLQHHPESVKKRDEISEQRYQENKKKSAWHRLGVCMEDNQRIEAELAALRVRCEELESLVQQHQTYSPKQSNKEVPREK